MSDRELVLDTVKEMPANASLRQIVDELNLLEDIKRRVARSERGEGGVPHDQVAPMLDSWITNSSGKTKQSKN